MNPPDQTISLPRRPEPPPRHPFPVLTSVAPVVVSVAIWVFTQSPFAMVFALLGPVIAIASLGDSRRQGRRQSKAELIRFDRELEATRQSIGRAHDREIDRLARVAPSAAALMSMPVRDPERWRGSLAQEVPVTLGAGNVASGLTLEPARSPAGADDAHGNAHGDALDRLRTLAATIDRAPVVVDARLGIGLCGPAARVAAAFNAIVVQLANALPPGDVEVAVPAASARDSDVLGWLASLPHWSAQSCGAPDTGPSSRIEFRSRAAAGTAAGAAANSAGFVLAMAAQEHDLPRECRVVVRLGGPGSARLARHPDPALCGPLTPAFVSAREGQEFSALLRSAGEVGSGAPQIGPPAIAGFAELTQPVTDGRNSLACCIGLSATGPVMVDLVADGPHAVVGGTTGSGKSELLVTWVLAMAAASTPQQVNFLLIDFKGGASFQAVRNLPHSVGLVTDLDGSAADRALQSLRAELRYRERVLLENGARSIAELDRSVALPRLVIVVDEFATLTSGFPELHELFSDLAARGRSLGVHLILCTQRPAGAVRDAVLANCTLRLSLRVNNRADSVAFIGSPLAAELPRNPVGRALLVSEGGSDPAGVVGAGIVAVQVAIAGERDFAVAMIGGKGRVGENFRPRRPWLDPLPARLSPEQVPACSAPGFVFGALDRPEEQRQEAAVYDPDRQGSLLVLGGHGSGKTGSLAAIASAAITSAAPELVLWVPESVEGAWDVVAETLDCVRAGTASRRLLMLDDLDALLGRFPLEYEQAFVDQILALLREGGRCSVHLAITATRMGSGAQAIASSCEARLLLRMPDRQEHVMAGGSAAAFDPALVPGAGLWNGLRVQVVAMAAPERRRPPRPPVVDLGEWRGLAVVASNPGAIMERLSAIGDVMVLGDSRHGDALDVVQGAAGRPGILLGDPDAWQADWGLIGSLRAAVPVLFHGCTVAEFRAITRSRTLPPPICAGVGEISADSAWLLVPGGRLTRVRLP